MRKYAIRKKRGGQRMPSKRYLDSGEESTGKEPMVKEAKGQAYAREKDRRNTTQVALSIAGVKRRLKKPVKRSNRDIAWALEIAGIGYGPEDLSRNMREYLYSDK
jgi:hypothetical protein